MYDTEKEDEKILLELFYPSACYSNIRFKKQINDWQNIDIDHSYDYFFYKNTIKLSFLGYETFDNEYLNQFSMKKQAYARKIKSLTWYTDADDDLRVKNSNIFLIYRIRLIERKGFDFDCVKACLNYKDKVVIFYYKCYDNFNCHRILEEKIDILSTNI
ncbi:hypothetical protein COBT_000328 [Conglomerata obtusa]